MAKCAHKQIARSLMDYLRAAGIEVWRQLLTPDADGNIPIIFEDDRNPTDAAKCYGVVYIDPKTCETWVETWQGGAGSHKETATSRAFQREIEKLIRQVG